MKIGRVYKIIHNQSDIVYVGSTFNQLRHRFYCHKTKGCSSSIGKYIEKYGKKNFTIMLIKEYQVCDRKHLKVWEQFWINKLNCINIYNAIPFLWRKEYQKTKDKEYYENNKDKKKEYREKHRENKKEIMKQYYKKNKEKIKKHNKEYREKNGGQIFCEVCKCNTSKLNYNRHIKTKKHLDNLNKYKNENNFIYI